MQAYLLESIIRSNLEPVKISVSGQEVKSKSQMNVLALSSIPNYSGDLKLLQLLKSPVKH